MTNKEAIKIIDALIFQAYLEYEVERSKRGKIDINNRYNALTLAKEALEKQIPKKPDLEVDDYVEVVRCKDCKYSRDEGISGLWCDHPDNRNPCGCRPTDYCNDGERKENADK